MNLNTVHKHLQLSKKNRVIANTNVDQRYPDHPGRFDYWWQVLCAESICGRCYWEVEWDGSHGTQDVGVSVSYESIRRKGQGDECKFGYNAESWSLDLRSPVTYSVTITNRLNSLQSLVALE